MHHSAEHDSLLPSAPSFTCCESSLNPAFPRCRCCFPLVSKLLLNWAIYLPPSPSYNVCHLKTSDFFFFFWVKDSLHNTGYLETCSPLGSAYWVLEWQGCAVCLYIWFKVHWELVKWGLLRFASVSSYLGYQINCQGVIVLVFNSGQSICEWWFWQFEYANEKPWSASLNW